MMDIFESDCKPLAQHIIFEIALINRDREMGVPWTHKERERAIENSIRKFFGYPIQPYKIAPFKIHAHDKGD